MIIAFGRLASAAFVGAVLALAAPFGLAAHAQCDPSVCANPNAYRNLVGSTAPRTFTSLKSATAYCGSQPIVWRASISGKLYAPKSNDFGKVKPGFYMCRFQAKIVARINAQATSRPR
jgi:hypothetical protein